MRLFVIQERFQGYFPELKCPPNRILKIVLEIKRYENAVDLMVRLFRYGVKRGNFCAVEPRLEAEHLTISLEGLKIASVISTFSEKMVSQQLKYQLNKIIQNDDAPQ